MIISKILVISLTYLVLNQDVVFVQKLDAGPVEAEAASTLSPAEEVNVVEDNDVNPETKMPDESEASGREDIDNSLPTCSARVLEMREYIAQNNLTQVGVNARVSFGETLIMFSIIFISAVVIAGAYNFIRTHYYDEDGQLDSGFDAGGNVGIGITGSTIVARWTWAATLLQSSSVGAKFGISGPYWYAAGATIQILLMSIMAYYLKLHAPGAKTFLQIIRVRFGVKAHIIVIVFALFTNVIVTLSLLLGGTAVLTGLIQGLSAEFASMLLVVLIGGYTLIGGLGATFYVCYFNCFVIFAIMVLFTVEIFYNPNNSEKNPFGSPSAIYDYVSCWPGPEGNQDTSWLTFYSTEGLVFGVVNIVGNFGAVFADQSYWQSAVATKPTQGVWGFLAGGLTWFAIPFGLATVMSLGYHGLSSAQGQAMLTDAEISSGLVVPLVSEVLLGKLGGLLTMVMMLMAVMSTGSSEIIAVASIIIYDIYMPYVRPFKKDIPIGTCLICEKPFSSKGLDNEGKQVEECSCPSMEDCTQCMKDDEARAAVKHLVKPDFQCDIHGDYRDYDAAVVEFKEWCIIYCTLTIIPSLWPAVIFGEIIGLDLGWIYLFTGVLVASVVIPVALSLMWHRTTAEGVSIGAVGGAVCAIASWLLDASLYEGGLSNFMANTGRSIPMLVGNVVAICSGGLICAVISYFTSSKEVEAEDVWRLTRSLDNPLSPWAKQYKDALNWTPTSRYKDRPSIELFSQVYRVPKLISWWLGGGLTILMVIVWPLLMLESGVQDETRFIIWTSVSQGWTLIAALYIMIMPLVEEIQEVYRAYQSKKIKERGNVITPFTN